jgi:hypothetical protein
MLNIFLKNEPSLHAVTSYVAVSICPPCTVYVYFVPIMCKTCFTLNVLRDLYWNERPCNCNRTPSSVVCTDVLCRIERRETANLNACGRNSVTFKDITQSASCRLLHQ